MPTDSIATQESAQFAEFIASPETLERVSRVVAEEFRAAEPQAFQFSLSPESVRELAVDARHSTA